MFSFAEWIAVPEEAPLPPRGERRAGSSLWSGTAACFLSRLQAPADSGGALACLHPSPGPGPSEAALGVQPREAADGGGGPGAPLCAKVGAPWAFATAAWCLSQAGKAVFRPPSAGLVLTRPSPGRFHCAAKEPALDHKVALPLADDVQLSVAEYRNRVYEVTPLPTAQRDPEGAFSSALGRSSVAQRAEGRCLSRRGRNFGRGDCDALGFASMQASTTEQSRATFLEFKS